MQVIFLKMEEVLASAENGSYYCLRNSSCKEIENCLKIYRSLSCVIVKLQYSQQDNQDLLDSLLFRYSRFCRTLAKSYNTFKNKSRAMLNFGRLMLKMTKTSKFMQSNQRKSKVNSKHKF